MHKMEEKESFSGKSKLISITKTCHFQPNLRSSSCTWHPLSLLWDVCQNGPWHLPIVAAQPRMDVAVPAPSPSSGHSAGSGGVTGHPKWHPKHTEASTVLNLHIWVVRKTASRDPTKMLGEKGGC